MNYTLIWERTGLLIRFSGTVTASDIAKATMDYQGDDRFDRLRYVIADYTAIDDCQLAADDIDYVWASDKGSITTNPKIRKAIVTTNPNVLAMQRRYEHSLGTAYPSRAFDSEADARRWLEC